MSGADTLGAAGPPSFLDRFRSFREGLAARPGFRRWAARFPLTRPFARRRARALFDLCAGFVYTQVLLACVRLDVFAILAQQPMPTQRLAQRIGLPLESAERLMAAAASLGLTARRSDGAWAIGPLGAAMIGNDGLAAMVEHHAMLYADLADPVALLRRPRGGNALSSYWAYSGAESPGEVGADRIRDYTALMAASQPMVAEEVLATYRFDAHRAVLDVGGGNGAFLRAVAAEARAPRLMLFDLPAVAEEARARFAAAGLGARASVFGGDFTKDALPEGADLITLVRVLHDHDDDVSSALLARIRAALPPGGRILIAEPMSGTAGAEPMGEAYFGFYLLAMGRGRPRRPEEIAAMLAAAGFARPRLLPTPTPLLTRVIVADVASP
ncbi:methyltransferase domain-containing protein [Roseomonas sp. PWR1]|uniref:Methyltransferase domain-containing protein n=1 Tax=Roseomonas nitratireducens TaxID=2820810 RepID=A0ABS4APR7_9PROT|nr:methyltransferase [Neoroseomonas nitratireducens]MBP0463350.1 methyltransferase domain-containing protein [Neoroseomonas nitratireducens]